MKGTLENNIVGFSVVRDLLLEGKEVKIKVQGQSMLPFFRSGSIVNLRPVQDKDLKKLAVVFADTGNHFVIHRIISIEGNKVTLFGDGNIIGTETMPKEKIYGITDCSTLHLILAGIWFRMRRFRRYPLAVFRILLK